MRQQSTNKCACMSTPPEVNVQLTTIPDSHMQRCSQLYLGGISQTFYCMKNMFSLLDLLTELTFVPWVTHACTWCALKGKPPEWCLDNPSNWINEGRRNESPLYRQSVLMPQLQVQIHGYVLYTAVMHTKVSFIIEHNHFILPFDFHLFALQLAHIKQVWKVRLHGQPLHVH